MINKITSQNVHGFRFSDFSSNGHDLDHGFKVSLRMIKSWFSSYQLLRVSPRAPPSAPSPSPTRRARFEDEDVTDLKTRWIFWAFHRDYFTSKDGPFSWGLHRFHIWETIKWGFCHRKWWFSHQTSGIQLEHTRGPNVWQRIQFHPKDRSKPTIAKFWWVHIHYPVILRYRKRVPVPGQFDS